MFTLLEEDRTGVKFKNELFDSETLNIVNFPYYYNGGGVAIGDINNDGLQDILFTGNMVKNRLYLNKGNFDFEDITEQSGVAEQQGWCGGATTIDINNDGFMDFYICRSADGNSSRRKNLLFVNNGDLSFSEKAVEYGLADNGYSTQASFFDYDKDGDLDCFIINHSLQNYASGEQFNSGLRKKYNPYSACRLYRNNQGYFEDVSNDAGIISNFLTSGLGLGISDINNDGWPDIYVSNDYNEPDYLFINHADGTFKEQISERTDQVSLYSMGSDIADYNNDGFTDIVTLDMLPEDNKMQKLHSGPDNFNKFQNLFNNGFYYQYSRNMLQKNNGDGTFSEIGQLAGISNTDWSWAPLLADYDNDGRKDLFVTNGYVRDYTDMDFVNYSVNHIVKGRIGEKVDKLKDYISKMPPNPLPNYIFQNKGDASFKNKTQEWGLDKNTVSTGAAYADLDNDGDLDLVINNVNGYSMIYKNNSETLFKNNYLKIKLVGTKSNINAIGTKVILYYDHKINMQEAYVSRGYQSSVESILNFGLGKRSHIDSVLVIGPNDETLRFQNIKSNQTLTISLKDADRDKIVQRPSRKTIFATQTLDKVIHVENGFNDFDIQSLLPNKLSRQGPCMSVADVNNDGLVDFFIGGAKGVAGQVYVQESNGEFTLKPSKSFITDAASEDTASDFFDADADGDMDLFVVSGGYEFEENSPALQDRLYFNDGKGNFIGNTRVLPKSYQSNGCVATADIDNDGDIDIFIGGRIVPGKYPLAPDSKILINDGDGNFTNKEPKSEILNKLGMVTDAVWMDMNNDQYPDLIVVGEWMPIKVILNYKGTLVDESLKYINFPSTGWWNRLYKEDMDGDGDMDLVVGNCGLNTQFRSTAKEPLTLLYKDFDQNGDIDPILGYYINGISYPVVSREDMTQQLPFLKKKYITYEEYSNATMGTLFTDDLMKGSSLLTSEMMQTIYLENNGEQGFKKHNLPIEAQYSPVYGIVSLDVDHDAHKDLLLLGNNTATRIKFGGYRSNHGVLLKGDGKGKFKYVPQLESGLNIKGDVRNVQLIKNDTNESVLIGINNSRALQVFLNETKNNEE